MKNTTLLIFASFFFLLACSVSKTDNSDKAKGSVSSDAALEPGKAESPMAKAAIAFLNSLTPELKEAASFSMDYPDREQWHFVPLDNRKGARIGHMSEQQQQLAFEVVKTGLSQKGYNIAREIMKLEDILTIKEKRKPGNDYRNSTKYYLSIFGTPSDETPWGWKYEGHHLSLNYSSVDGQLSVTPAFLGANPADVDIDVDRGKRVLGEMEDMGRAMMLSLTKEQQDMALISKEAYADILTEASSVAKLEKFEGLPYTKMNGGQQAGIQQLIQVYTSLMKPEVAKEQMDKIKARGLDKLYFSWAGSIKDGEKHYYRIHGPATIIEYDNVQNGANHIHVVWRDTENDFGRDLLKEHHEKHQH